MLIEYEAVGLDTSEQEVEYLQDEIVPWIEPRIIRIRSERQERIEDERLAHSGNELALKRSVLRLLSRSMDILRRVLDEGDISEAMEYKVDDLPVAFCSFSRVPSASPVHWHDGATYLGVLARAGSMMVRKAGNTPGRRTAAL